jgi:D-alanyl-D-alanine carboxypeptidase/D-alanyl-D-alanine-endopeptidase (penicillin-binding protein 4)
MKTVFTSSRGLPLKILLLIFLSAVSLSLLRPLVASNGKELPKSSPVSEHLSPRPTELARRIDSTIAQSDLGAARWGIHVISMVDGSTVYERDSDKLFTPASNMKIYTTGVALDLLGAEYRWRTSVYANSQPDGNGRVHGDLVLYGRGAPDLVASSTDQTRGTLQKLADDLYARGMRSVSGDVVGDESYFRGDPLGDGWQWNDLQWYFGAEASALSINGNEVEVNFLPAEKGGAPPAVRTSDTEGYVTVQNRMAVAERNGRATVGVHRGLSDNDIEVWGEFAADTKGFGARLSVYKPALWAAKFFVRALQARGIQVEGQTLSRDSRIAPSLRFDPSHSVELVFVQSQTLGEIARKTNKESNNLYAELVLRTLGRERGEMAALPEALGRERGDDEVGLAVIRAWLERAGIPTGRIALHDGSGLSRLDLVTPETSARFLLALTRASAGGVFKDSLPLSGHDGTLAGRLKTIRDRVSAKTGSLTYDNSLSGYLTTSKGQTLVFSIMCNDQTGRTDSIRLIDQIVTLFADYPNLPPEKPQKTE